MRLQEALELALRHRFSAQRDGEQAHRRAARCLRWLEAEEVRRPTIAALRRMADAMGEAGLGPASVNRHLSALSVVLEEAGLELALPWRREPRGRTRVLTRDEVSLLRAACLTRCPRVAALVGFLAETGMRVSEALALSPADISSHGSPSGHGGHGGQVWARVRDSKNGDPREVPLTEEALRCWDQGFLGLSQSRVNHVFRWARDQVASTRRDREVVPHALRHGLATRLVESGVSLPVVGAWLGHRSPSSTYRYCHPGRAGMEDALRKITPDST